MSYISTRGYTKKNLSFLEVVQMGLSPDGGLFVPQTIPSISLDEIENLKDKTYEERLFSILQNFELGISEDRLQEMIKNAYSSFHHKKKCPLSKVSDNRFIFELYHGPTASFKDMALQLTPHFFAASRTSADEKFCLLTATSGDTGIAAIEGFRRLKNISVFVIYPKDGVSSLQKKQMQAVTSPNVKTLGVDENFDFCQSATKQLFTDTEFLKKIKEKYNTKFAAGNSMNWGRLMPQIGYYFSAYADLLSQKEIELGEEIEICVPSGNFGNILGAFIAKKMGLPISKFICASNENNILTDFFNTGIYDMTTRDLQKTDSPSIDILKSSNIERMLYWVTDGDIEQIQQWFSQLENEGKFELPKDVFEKIQKEFSADFCTEKETHATIKKYFENNNILIDPHTAVALHVSDKMESNKKRIIASTAHYQKFAPAVDSVFHEKNTKNLSEFFENLRKLHSQTPEHPDLINTLEKKAVQTESISGNYPESLQKVEEFLSTQ